MSEACRSPVPQQEEEFHIIGRSAKIQRAIALARRFAPTRLPILLVGATGTGKELFAQGIHRWSGRGGAMVDVNCGAIPEQVAESLLFGHRRGAFTGAVTTARGLIEAAAGGTLFLDELCALAPEGQAKLLRALETGETRRVGEVQKHHVDFRLVAAVQEDLEQRVADGAFRPDLFQRLAGLVIELPTLADRREDILPLARHFSGSHGCVIDARGEEVLVGYHWPGNVRELRHAIDRAVFLAGTTTLNGDVMAEALQLGSTAIASRGAHRDAARRASRCLEEHDTLLDLCTARNWNLPQVAAELRVSRATLYRRLRAAGVSRPASQSQAVS